jgi:hypothetical protein
VNPYRPRKIRFHGVEPVAGFRLKLYSISMDGTPIAWPPFSDGLRLALAALPRPAVAPDRPGLGFVIAHRGRGDYAVLAWWDRENELPLRVFVRPQGAGARWRPAREGESVCVWDLEVIAHERDAYVETLLASGVRDRTADYLDRAIGEPSPAGGVLTALRLG